MVLPPQYLEWREKQYDVRERVDVFGGASATEPIVKGALVYIASQVCRPSAQSNIGQTVQPKWLSVWY